MSDNRPREKAMPIRAMSFSHTDRMGLGISLDHRDSISPPEYYGVSIPPIWDSTSSVPSVLPSSMQSFGTTLDDAILDR